MSRHITIILLFFTLVLIKAQAQIVADSSYTNLDTLENRLREIQSLPFKTFTDTIKEKPFRPDPMKSVWMGAILPGYGQILNQKYWKLPLVYGGFLGCAYALVWNGGKFQTYQNAYKDITDADATTNSFLDIIPKGYNIDSPGIGGITTWTNTIKSKQDNFRRFRDLSIIATIGYYALTLVDAYVDAQLYDFDISPDLSLKLQPTLLQDSFGNRNSFGMQCSIQIK